MRKKCPTLFYQQRIFREEHGFLTKNISCNKKKDYRPLKSYMNGSYVRSHCTQPGILMFEYDLLLKFRSHTFILLGGIFCLEFQYIKMAPPTNHTQRRLIVKNSFCQGVSAETKKLSCECDYEPLSRSHKYEELVELEKDLAELLHLLHVVERPSVKEVIQANIDVTLVKMESLNDFKNQLETKLSWSKVATLKQKKSKYKLQDAACFFPITSNRYNLLCNDTNDDDKDNTHTETSKLGKPLSNRVQRERMKNHKKGYVENKVRKVLILGDSHARGCSSEVKNKLNSEYEVSGFINPGSDMRNISESAKNKMVQLTNDDFVVLWGGSNNVARNNSVMGVKHILDLMINSSHTNVILLSVPHRHDLISDSCVNREVVAFNNSLRNRLKRFSKVKVIDVTNEREFYTRHGQHLNSRGKESMATKIAQTIESIVKEKANPISMKWQDDEVTSKEITTQQEHKHFDIQKRSRPDSITTTTMHNVNTTTMTPYPITTRASDGNTVLEKTNGTGENPNATQLVAADVEAPVDDTTRDEPLHKEPRTSRRQKKPPSTKIDDFLWETTIKCQAAIQ
jgi:hypothetical protein